MVYIWMFPKKRGTPKWMVKIMENPIKMNDLGGFPPIFGNPPSGYRTLLQIFHPFPKGPVAIAFAWLGDLGTRNVDSV